MPRKKEQSSKIPRRSFLGLTGAALVHAIMARLPKPAAPDFKSIFKKTRIPDPLAARFANPNWKKLRMMGGVPMVKSKRGDSFLWVEWRGDRDDPHVVTWEPETPMEWADANELYDLSTNWMLWKTPEELEQLLKEGKKFLIRYNFKAAGFLFVTPDSAKKLLAARELDESFLDELLYCTSDPDEAATFTAKQIRQLLPMMVAAHPAPEEMYFEPVKREDALKDLRLLRLRTTGWGPQVGQAYSVAELQQLFKLDTPPKPGDTHPFIPTFDGWICLAELAGGPGRTELRDSDRFTWTCGCPPAGDDSSDEDPGDEEPTSCQCLPEPMRNAEEMLLVQIFARQKKGQRYMYLGIGHLHPTAWSGVARMGVVPALSVRRYRDVGGNPLWKLACSVRDDDDPRHLPLDNPMDAMRWFNQLEKQKFGWLSLHRWGGERLKIRLFQDQCTASNTPRKGWKALHLIDPDFTGEPNAEIEVACDGDEPKKLCARTLVPRTLAAEVLKHFLEADGKCPWPDRWTNQPYGDWTAIDDD